MLWNPQVLQNWIPCQQEEAETKAWVDNIQFQIIIIIIIKPITNFPQTDIFLTVHSDSSNYPDILSVQNTGDAFYGIPQFIVYMGVLRPTYFPMSLDRIDSVVGKKGLFMCRTESLSLLQRLKGSMSGDACNFNNNETRAVIKYFFCKERRRRKFMPFW